MIVHIEMKQVEQKSNYQAIAQRDNVGESCSKGQ